MVELKQHRDGVLLPVRAQPGARTSGLRGAVGGALRVSVTAAPEKGKANKSLVAVLSKQLGLRKSQVQLVSGRTALQKRFLVRDITLEELEQRILQALRAQ